jgi:ribosomal protein S18 acetylase RimI-like enzyme
MGHGAAELRFGPHQCGAERRIGTMSLPSRIVPISEEHIEGFHKCLDSVARERRFLASTQAPSLDSTKQFVLSNIENKVPQFVALFREEVIGWCDVSPMMGEGFAHCGRLGMGVHRDFRGQGIGTQLLAQAMQKSREKGLERIELEVYGSNESAIRFYERAGFVVEGVKKRGRKLDGEYDDLVQMAVFI